MYNISECSQTIGEEIPQEIKRLYSTPTQEDLVIESATATMNGKYFDTNVSIRNQGLKKSKESILKISIDKRQLKEIKIPELDIGYGTFIELKNIWIPEISINQIEYNLDYNETELDKKNNWLVLN